MLSGSKVFTWGHNEAGQLGAGDFLDNPSPQPLSLPGPASRVFVGDDFAFALTSQIKINKDLEPFITEHLLESYINEDSTSHLYKNQIILQQQQEIYRMGSQTRQLEADVAALQLQNG